MWHGGWSAAMMRRCLSLRVVERTTFYFFDLLRLEVLINAVKGLLMLRSKPVVLSPPIRFSQRCLKGWCELCPNSLQQSCFCRFWLLRVMRSGSYQKK